MSIDKAHEDDEDTDTEVQILDTDLDNVANKSHDVVASSQAQDISEAKSQSNS